MPIQIRQVVSLPQVEQKIRVFEERYSMASAQFSNDKSLRGNVPEFDAIDWNLLLMQQKAMLDDDLENCVVFSSKFKTKTSNVDTQSMYEDVAA